MKGLIIYATCYGSTQQYADWIADATGYETVSYKTVTDEQLKAADALVIGSWVLAHKLCIGKWIEDKKDLLKGKDLYFYSVSGAKPGDKVLNNVFKDSVPAELLDENKCYQFGGKRETKNMSGFHKFMMFIATTFIEKDKEKKAEMKRFVDNVDKKYTKELIAALSA